ncbi:MAG: hypothetical protein LAO30_23565 [Acidobacteriia bacterium]|nr:hypothetical protein [Terriglobia bacterium]
MTRKKSVVLFISVILLGIPVIAQTQGPRAGRANYDPKTETKVSGTVEDVQQYSRGGWRTGTHLTLKTDSETLDVHVGPSQYVSSKQFSFAKGDQIEVLGAKVKIGDADVLIAREITKAGKTLTLRNAQGIPLWSRGRRAD